MHDDFLGRPFDPNGPESGGHQPLPEGQRILQGLLAELPDEALTLVEKINQDTDRIDSQLEDEVARIREQAEKQIMELESKAENRRKGLLQHAMEQLEPLQKDLFRKGELGMALATYVQILALKAKAQNILPDPGTLMQFQQVGKSYHFRVNGHNQGAVWGTDVYTADSHLSTAAVHCGAVEFGEESVVKVSIVDMSNMQIRGSMRNGVMSHDWGPYRVGYRIART